MSEDVVMLFCVAGVALRDIRRVSGRMCVCAAVVRVKLPCLCGSRKNVSLHTYTPHFIITPHFTLHPWHFTLYTPHSTLSTLHFTLHTLHSTLYTPHSTLCSPHFTLHTLHSTLYTSHSTSTFASASPWFALVSLVVCVFSHLHLCDEGQRKHLPQSLVYSTANPRCDTVGAGIWWSSLMEENLTPELTVPSIPKLGPAPTYVGKKRPKSVPCWLSPEPNAVSDALSSFQGPCNRLMASTWATSSCRALSFKDPRCCRWVVPNFFTSSLWPCNSLRLAEDEFFFPVDNPWKSTTWGID